MELGLTGKVVLVTGGSKGLGLATARAFAREGARVAIASRDPGNLAAARAALAEEGLAVETVAASFGDPREAAAAVAEVEARLGPLDILINSAGAAKRTPAEQLTPEIWRAGLEAKFFPYVTAQDAVLKRFLSRAETDGTTPAPRPVGVIVNIVGTGGRVPKSEHLPGGSSNAALLLSTLGLAQHYARYGIRINAINPGVTVTDRLEQNLRLLAEREGITREEAKARLEREAPMRRLGRPEEIADVALFLASERASYVVGALVSVDGAQNAVF